MSTSSHLHLFDTPHIDSSSDEELSIISLFRRGRSSSNPQVNSGGGSQGGLAFGGPLDGLNGTFVLGVGPSLAGSVPTSFECNT